MSSPSIQIQIHPNQAQSYSSLKARMAHKARIARMANSLFEAQEKAVYGDGYAGVQAYKKRIRALEAEVEELRMQNLMLKYDAILAEQGIGEVGGMGREGADAGEGSSERLR
ncbi:hypothetical protein G7Y79_00073g098440 [Physcia stellaris]|nr:hypothetical protein G7Y79_00073g098440 [Physcia stellaris]